MVAQYREAAALDGAETLCGDACVLEAIEQRAVAGTVLMLCALLMPCARCVGAGRESVQAGYIVNVVGCELWDEWRGGAE